MGGSVPHSRWTSDRFGGPVADGLHARTDGFTSLAVLIGAGGVALGFPLADPIIGLAITVAILAVLRTAVRDVFRRLMDGVDPEFMDNAEAALARRPGVRSVRSVRMRCIGRRLHADAELDVDPTLSLAAAHRLAHESEHDLIHAVPKLTTAMIHAYPTEDTNVAEQHREGTEAKPLRTNIIDQSLTCTRVLRSGDIRYASDALRWDGGS